MDATNKLALDNENIANVRYNDNRQEVASGLMVNTVNTVGGPVPILVAPGNPIGSYTSDLTTSPQAAFTTGTARDVYLLDESTMDFVWLGSEMPTVLEIPVGVNGALTKLFIVFQMIGLAVRIPTYNAKIRAGIA